MKLLRFLTVFILAMSLSLSVDAKQKDQRLN